MELKSDKLANQKLALTNFVYVHDNDFKKLASSTSLSEDEIKAFGLPVEVKGYVFTARPLSSLCPEGTIQFNGLQRLDASIELNKPVKVKAFSFPEKDFLLAEISFTLFLLRKGGGSTVEVDCDKLGEVVRETFLQQIFVIGQTAAVDFEGLTYKVQVSSLSPIVMESSSSDGGSLRLGRIIKQTKIAFTKGEGQPLKLSGGGSGKSSNLFAKGFNFNDMGIGGLDNEFYDIFRRTFASRVFPPDVVRKMGLNHVRGMLLYGPPGCGKTLIARKIGKALNAKEPKVVNGPEVLNKYVGGAEEKIRELFVDAEKDQAELGDNSDLHIIIFDEIDAICKQRGSISNDSGVHDSIVNQLLTKIDGVESLNNVLIIGMTNRKDLLDEAILRPGRLEVHVEIGLPNVEGRVQILNIHTASMRANGFLAPDVNIQDLAVRAKNYTGAEIEALVKAASSYAMERVIDMKALKVREGAKMLTTHDDFLRALNDVIPKFGAKTADLESAYRLGIIHHGTEFDKLLTTLRQLVNQVRESARTPLLSILLQGDSGVGKTALACMLAKESGYPFVKMISGEDLLGHIDTARAGKIISGFDDAHKSNLSIVIIDGIETLLEYVPIGPRFDNKVLQALLVLIKRVPSNPGRRVLVIGTTNIGDEIRAMGLQRAFNVILTVPPVSSVEEVKAVLSESDYKISDEDSDTIAASIVEPMPIKRLLLLLEMACDDKRVVEAERFISCLLGTGH